MKKSKWFLLGLWLMVLILTMTACQRDEEVETDFADPMVEEVLMAINHKDYEAFSKNFNKEHKEELSQVFHAQILPIREAIGDYEEGSKELVTAKVIDKNYVQVVYNASYSKEDGNVIVTTNFNRDEDNRIIEGFFMNSSKIQKMMKQ